MKFIKLSDKKNNSQILINFDKVAQVIIKGKYSRIVMARTLGYHYFDVEESIEEIEAKLGKV